MARDASPVIGLALGSGSARGWAHIGVIQELEDMGVRPQVVAGTSIGALVGAVYASGQLDAFSAWVQKLTSRDVFKLMDFGLSGGVVKGEKLFSSFEQQHSNANIEDLEKRFVSVATDMRTGREVWIRQGPILAAARASCAIPGLLPAVKYDDRWMLDGGLVNPVPVSACRALGSDVVIAVNLNAQLVGAHFSRSSRRQAEQEATKPASKSDDDRSFWTRVTAYLASNPEDAPGFFDTVSASINILQDRLTRGRLAGDPADVSLKPRLADFALMDFHRATEAIEAGRQAVRHNAQDIRSWCGL